MIATAIGLVLLSALLHALRDFYTKKAGDKQVFVWWYQIAAMLFFLPLLIYFLLTSGMPTFNAWLLGLTSGIIHFFYWIFLSKSYDHGDLSHVYPIMRSSPALVLLLAVLFLNETVSTKGVTGILIVAVGIYIINLKGLNFKSILEPIVSIFKEKASRFALLTLFTITAYSLVDKVGVAESHPIIFVYLLLFFAFIPFTPYILITKPRSAIVKEWNDNKKSIALNGFLMIASYSLILLAFTLSSVSYVVGLRQISIVFAVLLGGHILKENHKNIRLFAATLIFVGAFLIATA